MKVIDEIIKETFLEASKGLVKIFCNDGYWSFYTRFYTKINGVVNTKNSNYPIIEIPNYKLFLESVNSYLDKAYAFYFKDKMYLELNDREYLKKLFLDLIISASSYDFTNIISYIKLKEAQLNNTVIKEGNYTIGKYENLFITCSIFKNSSNLEGPYQMKISFIDDISKDSFDLPSLTFGIENNIAHIMCIQNKNKDKNSVGIAKKLDRYFRKVNKDVDMESYLANVSPNSLISLTIFNSYLKKFNINEVVANNYLPIRYNANKVAIYNKYKNDKETRDNTLSMYDYIQSNITDKFTYLFFRYANHFDKCECDYDDFKQEINLKLNDGKYNSDNIIYKIDKAINDFNNTRLTR